MVLEITNYNYLTCRFLSIVNKHAPLKAKVIRGSNVPFIDKKLKKEIYRRSAQIGSCTDDSVKNVEELERKA